MRPCLVYRNGWPPWDWWRDSSGTNVGNASRRCTIKIIMDVSKYGLESYWILKVGPWLGQRFRLGPIYTWRRIFTLRQRQRILNEVSTDSRRILNKDFFLAGEEFFFVDEFLNSLNKILQKQTYKVIKNGVSQKILNGMKFKVQNSSPANTRRRKILRRVFVKTSLSIRWQILRHV